MAFSKLTTEITSSLSSYFSPFGSGRYNKHRCRRRWGCSRGRISRWDDARRKDPVDKSRNFQDPALCTSGRMGRIRSKLSVVTWGNVLG